MREKLFDVCRFEKLFAFEIFIKKYFMNARKYRNYCNNIKM